jgi:NADH-quinone oxidoreductase subunit A
MTGTALFIFFICSVVMVGAGMIASHMLAPRSKNLQKEEPYECGIPTRGTSWIQFRVGYYLFAIIFLIFDVETVFLFPWAVVMKEVGPAAFIEIVIFLGILGAGLLYAWKKGALTWE